MPDSQAALDSPPREVPARKVLKRSYSATSIGSLPTPPRTRKRKRSRSRHSRATDSDSESDNGGVPDYDSDEEEILERQRKERGKEKETLIIGHKKRKILRVDAIAAELSGKAAEDAFWGVSTEDTEEKSSESLSKCEGSSTAAHSKEKARDRSRSKSPSRSPSCSPAAHLLKKTRTGLLSPPQSHRHKPARVLPFPIPVKTAEPQTPPRKGYLDKHIRRRLFPQRDSPDNPFLDDAKSSDTAGSAASLETETSEPQKPAPYIEKPTVTYVFRGVRTEFDNPLYDPRYPETGVAPPEADPDNPSKLPPEHPEFEAEPYCPPKLLFPEAHRKSRRKRTTKVVIDSGESDHGSPSTSARELEDTKVVGEKAKGKEMEREVVVEEAVVIEVREHLEAGKGKSNGKKPAAGTRKLPAKKSIVPPEWESTDDEAGEPDDELPRIELPRGFVPKAKEPAPVTKSRTRAGSARRSEEPSRPPEKGSHAMSRRSGSKDRDGVAVKA